jgi:uncharacterized membrane protein
VTSNADRLVDQYLDRLERELADVPRARRAEIVDDISAHIAQARAELSTEDEAAIRNLLEQLGDPAEIAADAGARSESRRRERRGLEIAALVLLLVGGIVLPVVGWLVGVVLLWVSDIWTTRDKLVGTLAVPGGLLPAVYLSMGAVVYGETCTSVQDPRTGAILEESCTGGPSDVVQVLMIGLFVVLLVGPFVTTAYLARRMGRRATMAAA